ncbi:hypothetical protein PybrP1_000824 [[Pythium] brassicae (nom. inval.)]|nr:hypothetical protein PybrP1_000824 [[Pythium] brassicae (nom. inval.)]
MSRLRIETTPHGDASSAASVPRFFFPVPRLQRKQTADTPISALAAGIVRRDVSAKLDALVLAAGEWESLLAVKAVLRQSGAKSSVVVIDAILGDHMALMLSKDNFDRIRSDAKLGSALAAKLKRLLPDECFLMLASDDDDRINGLALLEYLFSIQLTLAATRHLTERLRSVDGGLQEDDYVHMIHEQIERAAASHLDIDPDFLEYYKLICSRALLLPHDSRKQQHGAVLVDDILVCERYLEFFRLVHPVLRVHFRVDTNCFAPSAVRNIHRQYTQLDKDKNGMLSAAEVEDYGKKRAFNPTYQQPTHDLTRAFIAQVFSECPTYPPEGELDYKAYIDFTLLMADWSSVASLRFFWRCLDFQKQGFLDNFTLDYFLRDLAAKVRAHCDDEDEAEDGKGDAAFIERLRTQVFDIVAPSHPSRIAWKDLQRCGAGHIVVRILTDYVAFRAYEDAGGKLASQ